MSLNDRAGEALQGLLHGGAYDNEAVLNLLQSVFEDAQHGIRFPDGTREAARAIRDDPRNAALARYVWDGDWHEQP